MKSISPGTRRTTIHWISSYAIRNRSTGVFATKSPTWSAGSAVQCGRGSRSVRPDDRYRPPVPVINHGPFSAPTEYPRNRLSLIAPRCGCSRSRDKRRRHRDVSSNVGLRPEPCRSSDDHDIAVHLAVDVPASSDDHHHRRERTHHYRPRHLPPMRTISSRRRARWMRGTSGQGRDQS